MEEKNEDMIYLVKFCKPEQYEGITGQLKGENPERIGTPNSAGFPSEIIEGVDISKAKDSKEYEEWKSNATKTSEYATYFFYGKDLSEVGQCSAILAKQATSEEAENREEKLLGDCDVDYRVGITVFNIPYAKLVDFARTGKAEMRKGNYEIIEDGARSKMELDECCLNDDAMREICNEKELIAYGSIEALKNHSMWGGALDSIDTANSLNPDYVTSYSLIPQDKEREKIENQHKSEIDDFIKGLEAQGYDKETIDYLKSTYQQGEMGDSE